MNSIWKLSNYYFRYKKSRVITCVIGIAVGTIIMYCFLNLIYSEKMSALNARGADENYDVIVFDYDEELKEELLHLSFVKNAYEGTYKNRRIEEAKKGIFLQYKHPLMEEPIFYLMASMRGISFKESVYLTIDNVLTLYVCSLFIAMIIAIVIVGMIRNTLKMLIVEKTSEFGMLRCMGASKQQVRALFCSVALRIEGLGIGIGFILSMVIYKLVAYFTNISGDLYILPSVFVIVVFVFDLYFIVDECVKLVTNVEPVYLRQGEFYIKQKNKHRTSKEIKTNSRLGIELLYPMRNIKSNIGRFCRSVAGITISFVGITIISTILVVVMIMDHNLKKQSGLYNVQVFGYESEIEQYQGFLDYFSVDKAKPLYETYLIKDVYDAEFIQRDQFHYGQENSVALRGYEEEELAIVEKKLVQGRMPENEHEVVAVCWSRPWYSNLTLYSKMVTVNWNIGDKLCVADVSRINEVFSSEMANEEQEKALREGSDAQRLQAGEELQKKIIKELDKNNEILEVEIVGLVEMDPVCGLSYKSAHLITGVEALQEISARNYPMGIMCQMDQVTDKLITYTTQDTEIYTDENSYERAILSTGKRYMVIGVGIAILFYVITLMNLINVQESNFDLRRKEFSQLKIIGCDNQQLNHMMWLENFTELLVALPLSIISITSILIWANQQYHFVLNEMYYFGDGLVIEDFNIAANILPPVIGVLLLVVLVYIILEIIVHCKSIKRVNEHMLSELNAV